MSYASDLAAVKKDGWNLLYVKKQTPEICLAAVKQNGMAIRWVKKQTPEICLAAVKKNGRALEYVKKQTPEICLAAVKQDTLSECTADGGDFAIDCVKKQTPELCLIFITKVVKNCFNKRVSVSLRAWWRTGINYYFKLIEKEQQTSEIISASMKLVVFLNTINDVKDMYNNIRRDLRTPEIKKVLDDRIAKIRNNNKKATLIRLKQKQKENEKEAQRIKARLKKLSK